MFKISRACSSRTNQRFLWFGLLVMLFLSACRLSPEAIRQGPGIDLFKPQNGLIAYVGTDGNIYTVNPDGEDQRSITSDAQLSPDSGEGLQFYQFPTWSPNGERLAFVGTNRSSGEAEPVKLFTATPEGEELIEVYSSFDQIPFYLYWSPNSEQLSFLTSIKGENNLYLKVVPAEGGEVQVLGKGQPFYWDWSPDNRRIFIHTGGAAAIRSDAQLFFLNLNNEIVEDKLDLRPAAFQAPAWSPEGDELLFAAEDKNGQSALFLADDQGKVVKALRTSMGTFAFSWSPDGNKLAYLFDTRSSTQVLASKLTVIDPAKPNDEINTIDDHVIAFFWSPDSRNIAYFVPLTDTPGEDLIQFGESGRILQLSLRVLDVENGAAREIALYVPTNQFLNILPFFDQYQRSDTLWSPDSQRLVYSALEPNGKIGIFVADASGETNPTRLSEGVFAFWSWK